MEKNLLMWQGLAIAIAAISFIIAIATTASGDGNKLTPISWVLFAVSLIVIFVIQSFINTI